MYCSYSFYNTKHHTASCHYRAQCVEVVDSRAAERESGNRSRTEDVENGGHFGTDAKKVPGEEGAGSVEGKSSTKEAMLEFCLVFLVAMQLVRVVATKKVENITQLISDGNFDSGMLHQHVKETCDCKQILNYGKNEKLAEESFTGKNMRRGNRFSVYGAKL